MNNRQLELFNNLTNIVKTNDSFYVRDCVLDDKIYRVFAYRLASYTDFLIPDALEARGTMFEIDENEQPIRLAAWCQQKFFNLYENPMTMDLDLSKAVSAEVKSDGSLISTFLHNGELRLKSKTSLTSTMAIDALDWLKLPENKVYYDTLAEVTKTHTVNLEWVSPNNRIVIGYMEPSLVTLNVRCLETGRLTPIHKIDEIAEIVDINKLNFETPIDLTLCDPVQFIDGVPKLTNMEGYVIWLNDDTVFKLKTDWYYALHHCKDSVNNPRRLFEAVIDEGADDLFSMFHDDPLVIQQVQKMQEFAQQLYNSITHKVESFYDTNKHLDRKSYAIKGQQELEGKIFSLAMMLYVGKPIDIKQFLKKEFKSFGIKDENKVEEN